MKDTFALTHYFFSTHAIPYVITPKHKIQVIHYSDEDFAKICSFNWNCSFPKVIDKSGIRI